MPSLATEFLVVLSILSSGYIIYDAPVCRWWFPRFTGYVLYFRIITVGLALLFLCYALFYALSTFDLYPGLSPKYAPFAIFPVAIVCRVLADLVCWFYGKRNHDWKDNLKLKSLNEKGLVQFVYERIANKEMIMVTLENNKVYVGWAIEAPNNEENKWLRLTPHWSGYRDQTSTIKFQTDYCEVLDKGKLMHSQMLIHVEKIVTVHTYDKKIFQQFNLKS